MASTRNKNTEGNYKLEQSQLLGQSNYIHYESYAKPTETMFAGNGLLCGRVGSNGLSTNACDIESYLYGIGTTNLVTPYEKPSLDIKHLNSLNICKKADVLIPEPLVIEPKQRHLFG